NHAYQRHERKVVALRDHLRADEDVDLAFAKSSEHAFEVSHMPHCVPIDAADARIGKKLLQFCLETLGSFTDIMNVFAVTIGAALGRASRETAVMTEEFIH